MLSLPAVAPYEGSTPCCTSNPNLPAPPRPTRLLEAWVADARRHGVPAPRVVSWVRRKFGAHMTVYRCRKDGSLGCSTPCLLCSRELARFDIKVHCSLDVFDALGAMFTDHTAVTVLPVTFAA